MKHHRKRRYINWKKECRGVISVFLCLIISPLLMLASALVEYTRYQANAEIIQELISHASYSTLAEYDSYVQERFGLFALAQDCNVEGSYKDNLDGCISVLGKMAEIADTSTAEGIYPLSDSTMLRQQVLDFSENTVMAEFLLEGLNLQELLDKLNNLKGVEELSKATGKVANAAEKVEALVKSGSELADRITDIITDMNCIQMHSEELLQTFANFSKKLQDAGYDSGSTDEESLNKIVADYSGDIGIIYGQANTLYKDLEKLLSDLEGVPELAEKTKTAFADAKASLENARDSTGAALVEETSSETKTSTLSGSSGNTTDVIGEIIDELDNAVETAAESLKETVVNSIKDAAGVLKDELYNGFDLDKYGALGTYFSAPLSDEAKADLTRMIWTIPADWDGANPEGSMESLKAVIKTAYFPDNIDFSSLNALIESTGNIMSNAVAAAEQKLKDSLEAGLSEMLTALVAAIQNIFDLDIFCNPALNANLSDATVATLLTASGGSNPYGTMLEAVRDLFGSVTEFTNSVAGASITGMLRALAKLLRGVAKTFQAIWQLANKVVEKIKELVGYMADGNFDSLYDLLLLSAYMSYNLPDRTCALGSTSVAVGGGGLTYGTALTGKALTGYDYSAIPVSTSASGTGVQGLDGLLGMLGAGGTVQSDTMFKGAELEYVIAGTSSEYMNQIVVFLDLYILRLLMNIPVVFTDAQVGEMAAAATIACWVVYLIVLLGEPLCDTVFLVNGETSYFVKSGCYLTPGGIPKLIEKIGNLAIGNETIRDGIVGKLTSEVNGKLPTVGSTTPYYGGGIFEMDYKTHMLVILMASTTESDMLCRLANIIQLESAEHYAGEGGGGFDIRKTYTAIRSQTEVTYHSFLDEMFAIADRSGFKRTYEKYRSY